ncbi:C-type lectin domain family 4 member A-like [Paramisgurnus dabryanus]|uniref:C-type lectin domain family 4 member A-like n=1 Tax=Paramisgurnus dabryanus TaxID=90735 RepID=UPI0031F35699
MFESKRSEMSEIIYNDVIRTETLEMYRGEREEMMVDIYDSSEAVRNDEMMINTEMMSNERQQELQHTGRVLVKNRRHRSVQVCLCLLSVLLFTAVIVICVYFNNQGNYNHLQEKKQLILQINNLTKERDELINEREELNRWLNEQDWRSDNFKWIYYNLSFYYISTERRTWSDSRRDCEQREANLLIINNKEEQEFVQNATSGRFNYWIGLSKEGGVWKWVDGTTLKLSFWINRDPGSYSQNFAVISSSGWANRSCDFTTRWICEKII